MKKRSLLKKAGALMLALAMSVAGFGSFAPEAAITAKASNETQDEAIEISPNSEWTAWKPIANKGTHFYKINVKEDGEITLSASFKNCFDMVAALYKETDNEILTKSSAGLVDSLACVHGIEEDAPVTSNHGKAIISAGVYYIKVYGEGTKDINKGNGHQCYKLKTSFKGYGVSESAEDSYDNPKNYTINTVAVDTFTATDKTDWYKFNVQKEGKYAFNFTSYGYDYHLNHKATIYNSDMTEEKVALFGNSKYQEILTGDAFLTPGLYYIKFEGDNTKYSFSVKGSSIKKSKVTKVKSPKKKKAEITFKEIKDVNGYQIQYSTDKKFKKNVKTKTFGTEKTQSVKEGYRKITISKLKSKKKYYFRIRGYVSVNNRKFYSDWSPAKNVKIK